MKKTLAVLLSLCLILPCLFTGWVLPTSAAAVNPDEITGTVADDYKPAKEAVGIASLEEITDLEGNYYLTADIAANETTVEGNFAGTFDGCGHTINSTKPLFEAVYGGTVKNFVMEGEVTHDAQTGAVARFATGATFYNIWNKANVTCTAETKYVTGGFVAGVYGGVVFENCRNSGTVAGTGNPTAGICAYQYADDKGFGDEVTFRNCVNEGMIYGGSDTAGIFGVNVLGKPLTLENCLNTGIVEGENRVGGLVAVAVDKVSAKNCVNRGDVTSTGNYAGGIFGRIGDDVNTVVWEGRLENCSNEGKITAYRDHVAGISAYNTASLQVINCKNTGELELTTDNGNMGGIIGAAQRSLVCIGCTNTANLLGRTETTPEDETVSVIPSKAGGIVASAEGYNVAGGNASTDEIRIAGSTYFENCVNTGDIQARTKAGGIAGGIGAQSQNYIKYGENTFLHCLNTGNMTVEGNGSTTDHSSNVAAGIVAYIYSSGWNGYPNIQYCATYGNVTNNNTSEMGNAAYFLGYANSTQAIIRYNIGWGNLKGPVTEANPNGIGYPLMLNGNASAGADEVRDNFVPANQFTNYIYEIKAPAQRGAVEYTEAELASGALVARVNTVAGIKEAFYQVLGTDARPTTIKSAENAMVKADGDSYVNTTEGDPVATVTTETDERGYTLVKNENDFINMAMNGKYVLANDITLTKGYTALYGFWGELDGNGMTVTTSVPMFDRLHGVVGDFTVRGTLQNTEDDYKNLAPVARSADSATIVNVNNYANVDATVNTNGNAGGIVGSIMCGVIVDCDNYGTVSSKQATGGIFGFAPGALTVTNAYNHEGATVTGIGQVGGIGGWAFSTITMYDCTNDGKVECLNNYAAGILGRSHGDTSSGKLNSTVYAHIYRCENNGSIYSNNQYVGGIVGYSAGCIYIESCVNNGTLNSTGAQDTGTGNGVNGGGIIAQSSYSAVIKFCVNNADIILPKANVGGMAAKLQTNTLSKTLTSEIIGCVNNGKIQGPYASGGLLARFEWGTLNVTDSVNNGVVNVTASCAGGLLGNISQVNNAENKVIVKGCVNNGTVTGTAAVGGIVANYYAGSLTVENCLNTANVTSTASSYAGGLVANINGNKTDGASGYVGRQNFIRYSGNLGDVSGTNHTGGICGYQYGTGTNGSVIIEYCFTIGNVSSTNSYASGILGYSNTDGSQINYCYGAGKVTSQAADNNGNPRSNAIMWNNNLALASCVGNVFAADYAVGYVTEMGNKVTGGYDPFDNNADYVFATADFTTGALAYKLNETCGSNMWTQTLGTDKYPMANVAGGKRVTKIASADENGADLYTNGFDSMNVNAGSDLTVKYYFTVSGALESLTKALTARLTLADTTVEISSDQWKITKTAEGFYTCEISLGDVTPQTMGENITAELGSAKNTALSVKSYLLSLVKMTDEEMAKSFGYNETKAAALRTLAADLLVYGGAAQAYTGYLVNEAPILDDATLAAIADYRSEGEVPAATKTLTNNGTGATFKGATVLFDNSNKLAFRLTDIAEGAVVKISANGSEVELTEKKVTENGTYYYTPAINPNAYATVYTVTVYVNGVAGATATYSVNIYAATMQGSANAEMGALATALYYYGVSAAAFEA